MIRCHSVDNPSHHYTHNHNPLDLAIVHISTRHSASGSLSRVYLANHIRAATLPGGPGGGVLDKPTIERPTPGRESEFDIKRKKKTSPPYRVLLHNDNFNRREYVVQVLMKVIPGMTVDQAVNIMQEAHVNGMACVITCSQEDAEEHCTQLRTNGLISSIEPANKC